MKIGEIKKVLPALMRAGLVPVLVGPAGIGKTAAIKEIAAENNRELITLILSQMEPGDLIGLPTRREDRTVFLKPDWWPEKDETIVFLDEVNRAHRSIRNAIMQLLIDRRIHNHVLPKGTWIVAAMNPSTAGEDVYEVDEIIDAAFVDRFIWIKVEANFEEWTDYMMKYNNKYETEFLRGIISTQDTTRDAFYAPTKFELPNRNPTPRALERALVAYAALKEANIAEELITEVIIGIVGPVGKIILENAAHNPTLIVEDVVRGDVEKIKKASRIDRVMVLKAIMKDIEDGTAAFDVDAVAETLVKTYPLEDLAVAVRRMRENPEFWKAFRKEHKTWKKIVARVVTNDGKIDKEDVLRKW